MLLLIDIMGQLTPFFPHTFPSTTAIHALRREDCTVNTGILRFVYKLHDKWEVAVGMRDISLHKNEDEEDEGNGAHAA
jgi:hypothetical protein